MTLTKEQRREVWQKYGGRCAYCGQEITLKEMQADHFNPIFRNVRDLPEGITRGCDDIFNLVPACRACNYRKGTSNIEQFRKAIEHGLICCKRDFTYRLMLRYGLVEENPHRVVFYFEKSKDNYE